MHLLQISLPGAIFEEKLHRVPLMFFCSRKATVNRALFRLLNPGVSIRVIESNLDKTAGLITAPFFFFLQSYFSSPVHF